MKSPDENHALNLTPTVAGMPVLVASPMGGAVVALVGLRRLLESIALCRREEDGSLVEVPDEDVVGLDELLERWASSGTPHGSVREFAGMCHSLLAGEERAKAAPPRPLKAAPTLSEAALAHGADLRRLRHEAANRLEAVEAALEKHEHLVASGDVVGAAEVST